MAADNVGVITQRWSVITQRGSDITQCELPITQWAQCEQDTLIMRKYVSQLP